MVKWGHLYGIYGTLSANLLHAHMDDLSKHLSGCKTGCLIGSSFINHLMDADDLVIFSPCSAGLQQLLKVCSHRPKTLNLMPERVMS